MTDTHCHILRHPNVTPQNDPLPAIAAIHILGQTSGTASDLSAPQHMKNISTAVALRHARRHLLAHGECPSGTIDERLARSWHRSLAAGLLPTGRVTAGEHSTGSGLAQALARNHELLAHSRPVMEYLFDQVRHNQNVVILADQQGTLMHTLGDAHFLSKAERVSLSSGASWHENHRGTNAIGTALAELAPVEIHGAEHFLERNGFLTCAAAPIVSATGELLGILDISGEERAGHPHTLGLVSTAARMIENRLLAASCRQHIRLHIHPQAEGIGTVAEGILAVSEDGWLMGANRNGLALLGLHSAQVGGTAIDAVLDVQMPQLLSRHVRQPLLIHRVHRFDGTALCVQLQMDPSLLSPRRVLARSEPDTTPLTALSPSRSVANEDALSARDTGDARWRAAADKARRVLGKPIALLVQGESGVGKELFARAWHESGNRRKGPFVAINCAAIPEHLIESELFGHESGAFTGARREGRPGQLREAHGGTLFLDEIGDMPLTMQTRLLRVLQERQVTPLGGGQPVAVDFALVCATHHRLREAADQGRFRSDLYYRINGLTVELPPLRERTDFDALTHRLLAELSPDHLIGVDPDLLPQLAAHPWPGNLRQYASVLRTACAMLDPDDTLIRLHHLADDVVAALNNLPDRTATHAPAEATVVPGTAQSLQALSDAAIRTALANCQGNLSQAARTLGISRQTLYRKLGAQVNAMSSGSRGFPTS